MDINFLISLLTIIAFVLLGYSQYESYANEVTSVKSSVDDNEYLVRDRDDKQEAANMLATIRNKLQKLVDSMKLKYPNDESVIRMNKKFNSECNHVGSSSRATKPGKPVHWE